MSFNVTLAGVLKYADKLMGDADSIDTDQLAGVRISKSKYTEAVIKIDAAKVLVNWVRSQVKNEEV